MTYLTYDDKEYYCTGDYIPAEPPSPLTFSHEGSPGEGAYIENFKVFTAAPIEGIEVTKTISMKDLYQLELMYLKECENEQD